MICDVFPNNSLFLPVLRPMWRLLNKLTGYSSLVDYNGEEFTRQKGDPPPLDGCNVAGAAKLPLLLKHAIRRNFWALTPALKFLSINRRGGYAEFIIRPKDAAPRRVKFTNKKYHDHLISLVRDLVLEECELEEVDYFSTYFAVLKDMTTSRAIFNGRSLSESWQTPPPVNLADIAQVIGRVNEVGSENRRTWAVTGDLRHWFHQLSMTEELMRYMGLYVSGPGGKIDGGQAYRYKVLPMGFSYSPWLAQSVSWMLLSHRQDRDPVMVEEAQLKHEGCLPTFLRVFYKERECGWATVYYDNYLVMCDSEEAAVAWSKRILANATFFNIQIKAGTHKIVTPDVFACCGLEYLGVRFKITTKKRNRDSEEQLKPSVTWEMKNPLKDFPEATTKRDAARIVGKIMFHMVIHVTPLGRVEGFRDLVKILKHLSLLKGWDVTHNLDGSQVAVLRSRWEHAKLNQPLSVPVNDLKGVSDILATDAARKGFGYVRIRNGEASAPVEGHWTEAELKKWTTKKTIKIFLMEMHAAVESIKKFFEDNAECKKLLVAVDNSGVAYSLRKGFSSLDEAQEMIDKVMHLLHRIEIIQVISADNCADCPSRRSYEDFEHRVRRTVLVCAEQTRGVKIGVAKPRRASGSDERLEDAETFEDEVGVDWMEPSLAVEDDE
jgi:hypothetical protein